MSDTKSRFSAIISIGAKMGSSVKSAFGGTKAEADKLRKSFNDLNSKQRATAKELAASKKFALETEQRIAAQSAKVALAKEKLEKRPKSASAAAKYTKENEALRLMQTALKTAESETARLTQQKAGLAKEIDRVNASIKRLVASGASLGKLKSSFRGVADSVRGAGRELGSLALKGGIAAAGIGYVFKSQFIDTAAEFERFETILKTVEGSSEKAGKSMDWISEFAAKTPYELAGVTGAFVKLKAYGMDPIKGGLLKSLGDTSSAMGKDLMQSVEAMADAVTGENERLKEFGIKGSKKGGKISYEYTDKEGKQRQATVDAGNRKMIQSTLQAIWNNKYKGAMDEQSKTWEGLVANVADQWTRFKKMVMKSGPFDWMKGKLQGVLDTINQMEKDGGLQKWADKTGKAIVGAFKKIWAEGKKMVGVAKWAWDIIKPLGGVKLILGVVAAITLAPLASSVLVCAASVAILTKTCWGVMAAMGPLGWAVALAAGSVGYLAYTVYKNWGPLKDFSTDLWNGVCATFKDGWGIVAGLFSAQFNLIRGVWTGNFDAFKKDIDGVVSHFISAFDRIKSTFETVKLGIFGEDKNANADYVAKVKALNDKAAARRATKASGVLNGNRPLPALPPISGASGGTKTVNNSPVFNITMQAAPGQDAGSFFNDYKTRLQREYPAFSSGALTD